MRRALRVAGRIVLVVVGLVAVVGMLLAPDKYHVIDQPGASAKRIEVLEQLALAACPGSCAGVAAGAPCGGGDQ